MWGDVDAQSTRQSHTSADSKQSVKTFLAMQDQAKNSVSLRSDCRIRSRTLSPRLLRCPNLTLFPSSNGDVSMLKTRSEGELLGNTIGNPLQSYGQD